MARRRVLRRHVDIRQHQIKLQRGSVGVGVNRFERCRRFNGKCLWFGRGLRKVWHRQHGLVRQQRFCGHLRRHGRSGVRGIGGGHAQWQQRAIRAHRIRRNPEGFGLPRVRSSCCDVIGPSTEGAQRLGGELQQRFLDGFLLGQPGIERLLHGPRGFTKFVQPHHARATLEGMEGPPQRGLLAQVTRCSTQRVNGRQAGGDNFARLFQEDVEQFILAIVLRQGCGSDVARRNHWKRGLFRSGHRRNGAFRRRHVHVKQRKINVRQCRRRGALDHSRSRGFGCVGEWELQRGYGRRFLIMRARMRQLRTRPPHEDTQLAQLFVVNEELARHGTLVAQHVDEKAQRSQAVAQFLENLRALFLGQVVGQHALDRVAHAHHGQGGLIQSQHGQHAAHLLQAARHGGKQAHVFRAAEELVHGLLCLCQSRTQFTDHATHGLVVTDAAIQLFHPGFKRLRFPAGNHAVQSLGQPRSSLRHVLLGGIQFLEGRLQIQHRGGHFHGQRCRRRLARPCGGLQGTRQGQCQAFAVRVQFAQ